MTVRFQPLPLQRAIAHVLDTLDDKIELNRRMTKTLEAMARALFKSWFVTDRCRQRYEHFKVNEPYHTIRKSLALDERFGRVRLLDPGNAKSAKKTFFNPNIMAELDKHYTKMDSN